MDLRVDSPPPPKRLCLGDVLTSRRVVSRGGGIGVNPLDHFKDRSGLLNFKH